MADDSCSGCGTPIPPDAPAGNCPRCLMRQVLTAAESARPLIRFFGDYEITGEIAHGGMGIVYRARQISLNRPVALKMILAGHLATPSLVQRFRAEAEAAARLDHPNIIPIYEIGEHEGQHYYSMRLLDGGSLADRIKKEEESGSLGRLPAPALSGAMSLLHFAKIARAVHHAHQRGILHRDLKPTNIVLDASGEPHVSDFGLAKILEDNLDLTQSLAVLGTPAYMAPEQAAGQSKHLTTAADVYSLGAILYELLCGQPPFRAETALATLRKVTEQLPARPSSVNPKVDLSLETICLKCLEKEPARRYGSAELLAEDLERWGRGEPVLAQPVSQPERIWRWCRRKPALASAWASLILVFVIGFAAVTWEWQRAETHATRETHQHRRAQVLATRMTMEKADALFGQDRAADALAYLAELLHQSPTNLVVAERIISALSQRSFCLPIAALRHAGPITSVQLSPDGRRVLTASVDKTARLWDAETGGLLLEFRHQGAVESARFSPDGGRIITASRDHTAQLWDSHTGHAITAPLAHDGEVYSAEFSPGGDRVATASADGTVRVWDALTGAALIAPLAHGSNAVSARFSANGESLVTASREKTVRVWNARNGLLTATLRNRWEADEAQFTPDGKGVLVGGADLFDAATGKFRGRQFDLHVPQIYSVQFSPDGRKAVTASADSTARIWDFASGAPLTAPLRHDSRIYWAGFGPHGLSVVTCGKDRAVRVWDALSGQPISEPLWHDTEVRFAELSADGRRVVTLPVGEVAWLWDLRTLQPLTPVFAHEEVVRSACWSKDGQRVLTASWDHTARLWDLRSGQLLLPPLRHRSWVDSAQFSPDESMIVTASHDTTARVWDARTGESLAKLSHQDVVAGAEFSPDGVWVVTASEDRTAQVWSARTGQVRGHPLQHQAAVHAAHFSPKGDRILTASSDHTARIWAASSGQELTPALRHTQPVQNARFSPDGRWVVTVCLDNSARVWDAASGKPLTIVVRHEDEFDLSSPQFDPAGTQVATASRNGARIWDLFTGQALTEPLLHAERVTSVRFDPSGRRVVTTAKDDSARLWDVATGLPVSEAMLHSKPVTCAEFSSDGRWLVTGSYDGLARVWEIPQLAGLPPAWLADLAEAVGGKRFLKEHFSEPLSVQKLWELRTRLMAAPSGDSDGRWAGWFFSESSRRTISPSSPLTVSEYVQRRMEDKNVESLRLAVRLAPANGVALARLAMALFNSETNQAGHAAGQAQWWARRAVKTSPEEVETWLTNAKLLEREGKVGPALDVMAEAALQLPSHPAVWNAQGLLLLRTNRLEEAYARFSKAILLTQGGTNFANVRAKALSSRAEVLRAQHRAEEAQADFLEAKRIPPRSSQTSADLVDLTAHYNGGLTENWRGLYEHDDLTALPPGILDSDGLAFDVRGVVQLLGHGLRRLGRRFPERVEGIQVGRTCQHLHLLHAAGYGPGAANGAVLAHLKIHYANGTGLDVPLVYGRDVGLHWVRAVPANPNADPVMAWRGRVNPADVPAAGFFPVLYRTTWTNPRPTVPIVALDFVSAMGEVDYFLVGLTVD